MPFYSGGIALRNKYRVVVGSSSRQLLLVHRKGIVVCRRLLQLATSEQKKKESPSPHFTRTKYPSGQGDGNGIEKVTNPTAFMDRRKV